MGQSDKRAVFGFWILQDKISRKFSFSPYCILTSDIDGFGHKLHLEKNLWKSFASFKFALKFKGFFQL